MIFVPILWPDFFAANAANGSNTSTSALWLEVMGIFQGSLGLFHILSNEAAPFAVRVMTFRLPSFKAARRVSSGVLLRPLRDGYLAADSNDERRMAA